MVSCFGLSWRPKVLIIFPPLMLEWRGDYVGMVLYLDDQHGILRLQVSDQPYAPLPASTQEVS
jgi:hypothetical protein